MVKNGRSPDPAILPLLTSGLAHRGPDGNSCYIKDNVGFIHTRLAIIDLATGDQPLFGPRNCALIANGEIYNNPELRRDELSDYEFKTGSDCEPILALYERYGSNCSSRLRGMYAFALHDHERMTLTLARDPFGIKPLYYTETPEYFAFSSEPQALIASGLATSDMAPERAIELLQLQFTTGKETIFRNIYRLLPGETINVINGHIIARKKISALPQSGCLKIDEETALEQLNQILTNSVMVHQRSDVPYGLFLSSGVDSATILAIMAQMNDCPVIAYTASFPDSKLTDEFPMASKMAKAVGADHVNLAITENDFWNHLPAIAASIDDPTADYAIIPTWLLAKRAAKDVKVILCGEGGDEIFAGYGRYRRQIRPWWLGGRQRRRTGPFSSGNILLKEPSGWRDGIVEAELVSAISERSSLQIAQAADCEHFLPHDLLNKLDRCLMAHGLEGRTPFLDPLVAEFGFCLPQKMKLGHNRGKYLLRRWLQDKMPESEPFASKKGFTVPVGEWIYRSGKKIGEMVASDPAIAEFCIPAKVHEIFASDQKREQEAAWRLLFYALWHRRHIRGLQPDGSVFDCF